MSNWPGKRLGLSNSSTDQSASGMWRINESFLAIKDLSWPLYAPAPTTPIQDGLIFALDTSIKTITSAKIYSTFNGLRSANYSVQYSDDNSSWTTAFSGVMSNNSSYGIQSGTNAGDGSYGAHRYWRYLEGSAVDGHHPRTSRIIFSDDQGLDYNARVYAADNQSDSGAYQVGTLSVDITLADFANSGLSSAIYPSSGTFPSYDASNGGVLVFNGSNNHVAYNAALFNNISTASYTFGIWTYTSGTSTQEWAAQWSSNNSGNSWFFGPRNFSGGNASIMIGDDWSSVQSIPANTWIYWLMTNDVSGNNSKLYRNGQEVASKGAKIAKTGVNTFYLGRQGSLNGEYLNGKLGPMHAWSRALSDSEISDMYNLYLDRF